MKKEYVEELSARLIEQIKSNTACFPRLIRQRLRVDAGESISRKGVHPLLFRSKLRNKVY